MQLTYLYPSPRVLQLDAGILDGELFSLLNQQLSDSFRLLASKSFSYSLNLDFWSLILKLVLFRVTTLKTGASYGYNLQNLKLAHASTGKVIGMRLRYTLLASIIGKFLFEKTKSYLYNLDESQVPDTNAWLQMVKQTLYRHKPQLLRVTDDLVKIAGLVNFVLFLLQGRYPSLLHRALGIIVTPMNPDLLKFNGDNVSFEFQNRQLVWNVMTEFLVFVIPLLNLPKWRRVVHDMMLRRRKSADPGEAMQTRFSSLPIAHCAICIEMSEASSIKATKIQVTNPYVTNCGHTFCYICLVTRRNAIENGSELAERCPRCNCKITSFKKFGEDDPIAPTAILVHYKDNYEVQVADKADETFFEQNAESLPYAHESEEVINRSHQALENDLGYSDEDMEDFEEEIDDDDEFDDDNYDDEDIGFD